MSTQGKIDFAGINAGLLNRAESFLRDLFPAGKLKGREFCVGDIHGSEGESLKINITNGRGADFASGETYSDLIAVYAAHHGIGMGEAAKQLSPNEYRPTPNEYRAPVSAGPTPKSEPTITRPPSDAPAHDCHHYKHGAPSAVYEYRDATGLLHYVARYNMGPTSKEIVPWSWDGSRWLAKGYPKPRPLYGLDFLEHNASPAIIVEGEKCVNSLRTRGISRIPITWSGGANAWKHTDWSPIAGRDVLLFPDHDAPGLKAMIELAAHLLSIAASVKIIDHAALDLPDGWDIADTQWSASELNEWARPLIKPITPPPAEVPRETESPDWVGYDPGEPGGDYTPNIPDNVTPIKRGKPRTKRDGSPPNGGAMIDSNGSAFVSWESLGLQTTQTGMPHPSLANVLLILANHPELVGKIWYDEFHGRIFSTLFDPEPTEWAEHYDTRLCVWIQHTLKLHKIGIQTVQRGVDAHARKHTRNEVLEWYESLQWDGTERLKYVMPDGFGSEQNEYTASVGRCFFVAMIARVYDPGCKHDYMPVFEGVQGAKKSSALDIIGGKWFAEQHEDITSKDFFQNLPGKLLFEISEMHAFRRAEVERIKGVVSCRKDRYRGSYERRSSDHLRMCAFGGTTNRDDWVADDTGARRFWPIRCTVVDTQYLRKNREQLFAEAVAIYKRVPIKASVEDRLVAGADWWNVDPDLAKAEVEQRRDDDVWTEPVMQYARLRQWVTVDEIMSGPLGIPRERHSRTDQMRVGSILRVTSFEKKTRRINGRMTKAWLNPALKDQPDMLAS